MGSLSSRKLGANAISSNYIYSPFTDEWKHKLSSYGAIKHCMVVVQRTIQDINPSQVPVITADQTVYALLKQIQWKYPNMFGEDSFVIMIGGLHLEMTMLAVLGLMLYWIWNQACNLTKFTYKNFTFSKSDAFIYQGYFYWFHSYEPLRTTFFSKQKFGHNFHY